MKIKKVQIENFRGIEKLDLDFVGPDGQPLDLVVLAGPNGCGKTTVLEACIFQLGRRELLPSGWFFRGQLGKGRTPELEVQFDLEGQDMIAIPPECERYTRLSSDAKYAPEKYPIEFFSSWREPKLIGSVSATAGKKGRRPKETEENRLWKIKQYLVNLIARKAFSSSDFQNAFNANDRGDALFRINQAWKLFYPSRNEEFVANTAGDTIEDGFDVFLKRKPAYSIPVDSLSSGEIEVFTMLGWFAINDFSDGIVFVDEPELHLHPAWHRVILRALQSVLPETQIICATHSAEILDSVYSYERFTLLPEDDPRIRLAEGDRRIKAS